MNHYFASTALFLALSLSQLRAQTELIVNGGFESGSNSWVLSGGANVLTDPSGDSRTGWGYLYLGGPVSEVDQAYQTITIPAGASSATLSFYYFIWSLEDSSGANDTFTATVRNTSGGILATVASKSNLDKDLDIGPENYHQQTFNLLPYAGQTIRIQFNSSSNPSYPTLFAIDDVSVQVFSNPTPPPPILSLRLSGNNVVLSWPTNAAGFSLQSASNFLASPSWTLVTNVSAVVEGQYTVTNATSGALKFYRLIK